jgi:hypothetical protein
LIFILGLRAIRDIKGYWGRARECSEALGCCPISPNEGVDVPKVPAPVPAPANENASSSSILSCLGSFLANSLLASVNPFKFFALTAGKPGRSHRSRENILLNTHM